MNNSFVPIRGANAFRLSNPCVLAVTALNASLQVFAKTDMNALRRRSLLLTGYLEILLDELAASDDGRLPGSPDPAFTIITPRDPDHRGCQLSLLFASPDIAQRVFARLCDAGVVCDERKPDVIRISPAPLYNTFSDVQRCVDLLGRALHA
nr:hypothetical protein HK105_004283 [Polyrhizophydium stewartii]